MVVVLCGIVLAVLAYINFSLVLANMKAHRPGLAVTCGLACFACAALMAGCAFLVGRFMLS